jgi:hypothetical protein
MLSLEHISQPSIANESLLYEMILFNTSLNNKSNLIAVILHICICYFTLSIKVTLTYLLCEGTLEYSVLSIIRAIGGEGMHA